MLKAVFGQEAAYVWWLSNYVPRIWVLRQATSHGREPEEDKDDYLKRKGLRV